MELKPVGYFSKTHGIKGQLVLKLDTAVHLEEIETLFTESGGSQAPHFVEKIFDNGRNIVVKLEETDTLEQAKELIGKTVLADASLVEEEGTDQQWVGFEVKDKKLGSLGKVKSVDASGKQILMTIDHKGKEIMLPLAEELIVKLDEKKRVITYNTPDGLLDIYLE